MAKKDGEPKKISNAVYERELHKLQIELVKMHEWVHREKERVCILFEGRDAAGKGGRHPTHHRTVESPHLPCRGVARTHRA